MPNIFQTQVIKTISTVDKNIKKLRKEKGLSQDRLFRLVEVSHATIIKIELGGIQSPTIDTIQKIVKVLEVGVDKLIK
ncbi:MAG: DNA-binding protein [Candidatus Altiarchaeales archaeon HGW-Altiarchaeales-1]|nr:MAG: DNA-binding protein [Candidatus Altiarchaeales archaeon HGW-Altiarchaeales-1]